MVTRLKALEKENRQRDMAKEKHLSMRVKSKYNP